MPHVNARAFTSARIWTLLAIAAGSAVTPAFAAPPQLFNKNIQFSWSTEVVQVGPDGRTVRPRIDTTRTVYVSSTGRLFTRGSRENAKLRLSKGGDFGPDGPKVNQAGETRAMRFVGNTLVGNMAYAQGAGQVTVSFDQSFSSCSLNILYGRERGGIRRRGLDGQMYEIQSMATTSQSCSVRAGNPFQ